MSKFFQNELAAYSGDKQGLQNVKFKRGDLANSSGATAGTLLEIIPMHIKNTPVIQFIAYIESFSDRFSVGYNQEQPFGRPDPYYVWKHNKRSINVNWALPASSDAMALDNLNNLSWFLASLYPTYKERAVSTSISASPMFRVRHANLISSAANNGQGLLCAISNVTVTHDMKEGSIGINADNEETRDLLQSCGIPLSSGKKLLIPKLMKISCTMDVVHDHALGWDHTTGQWRGGLSAPGFPYNFGLTRDTKDTPQRGEAQGPSPSGATETDSAGPAQMDGHPDQKETEVIANDIFNTQGVQGAPEVNNITPAKNAGN